MLKAMDGRVPTQQIKPIQDPHTGQMLTQDEEKANVLADHYEYVSSDKNIDPEYLKSKDKKLNERLSRHKGILDKKDYNTPITLTELEETLRQKAETAPGEDGITYAMLLHLPKEGKIFLLKIFNMIWDKGKIPSSFKEGIIMPLLKENKDPNQAVSYRPVTLTSHIGKALESIINTRLTGLLESMGIISKNQSGFQKRREALEQVANLEIDVQNDKANKNTATLAYSST